MIGIIMLCLATTVACGVAMTQYERAQEARYQLKLQDEEQKRCLEAVAVSLADAHSSAIQARNRARRLAWALRKMRREQ